MILFLLFVYTLGFGAFGWQAFTNTVLISHETGEKNSHENKEKKLYWLFAIFWPIGILLAIFEELKIRYDNYQYFKKHPHWKTK